MTGSLTSRNYTITDGCLDYTEPTFNANLDFTNIVNPISIEPTNSF